MLDRFDLGWASFACVGWRQARREGAATGVISHSGRKAKLFASSLCEENHFVVSMGEDNDVRVHNIKALELNQI